MIKYSHVRSTLPDLSTFFKDKELRWIEHDAAKSVYSISFTAAADSLSLWRAYGRDGRGVCIVIPTRALKPLDGGNQIGGDFLQGNKTLDVRSLAINPATSNQEKDVAEPIIPELDYKPMPENLYKIRYISKDGSIFDNSLADEFLKSLKEDIDVIVKIRDSNITSDEEKSAINHAVREAFAGVLYLFKDAQYAAEEEYRMITQRRIGEPHIFFDEADVPRLYLQTRPFVFEDEKTEIILGPGIENPEFVELSVRRIIETSKRFSKKIKVKYSDVGYRPKKA